MDIWDEMIGRDGQPLPEEFKATLREAERMEKEANTPELRHYQEIAPTMQAMRHFAVAQRKAQKLPEPLRKASLDIICREMIAWSKRRFSPNYLPKEITAKSFDDFALIVRNHRTEKSKQWRRTVF